MRNISVFSLIFIIVLGCSESKEELINKIENSRKEIFEKPTKDVDVNIAKTLIKEYQDFIDKFPMDTNVAIYLFQQAQIYKSIGEIENSIKAWEVICEKYPDSKLAAKSLFLQGFTYENDLKIIIKAQQKYSLFLEKYPNHVLAESAKFSLANIGKPTNQIIQEFEAKSTQKDSMVN